MTMQRLAALLVVAGLAVPGSAGDEARAKKEYRCEMDTQACLNAMASKLKGRGWVGIEWDPSDSGAITRVVPGSPAERDGLRVGDVIIEQDGVRFADNNWEKLKASYSAFRPGKVITYTIEREGKLLDVALTLGELPREVLAIWVGNHMLEHADTEKVVSN
jgi:predicted metalloprotease with PDZ domain